MNNLETAIDHVARQMTSTPASIDVRARVLERLETRASSRWGWTLVPAAAAICAAAGIALFIMSSQRPTNRPASPVIAMRAPSSVNSTPSVPSSPAKATKPAKAGQRIDAAQLAAADLAWRTRALPPLEDPDALTLERIQPAALDIRPLYTTPLTVPPFDDTDGREHN